MTTMGFRSREKIGLNSDSTKWKIITQGAGSVSENLLRNEFYLFIFLIDVLNTILAEGRPGLLR